MSNSLCENTKMGQKRPSELFKGNFSDANGFLTFPESYWRERKIYLRKSKAIQLRNINLGGQFYITLRVFCSRIKL